ncbi:nitrilase-related carbon-nitrogen hydrolase [Rhodococcus koreensis]|uniref:N-carbamoylputrescine amidase n=1 Tax=Rhodococcus koreensis TaxID=99653 RepID=A0A1H5CC22_9NOCA|nr:nitrilase-related carbon-nitrogen hydrolase [Rhodococcus koreensis]SED63954.1 N-carbamoylputrescine amidase [Rhodococcus koreensis]
MNPRDSGALAGVIGQNVADAGDFVVVTAVETVLPSPARDRPSTSMPVRVGAVQTSWHPDPEEHRAVLASGVRRAADLGAQVVCLQELTLSPYFATIPDNTDAANHSESIPDGPTTSFVRELAARHDIFVHASLYEHSDTGRGFNTAILVAPDGAVLARTRKLHIPAFPGYHEDRYFDSGDSGFPVIPAAGGQFGFPTCWDQWFPELARAYSMRGAEILVYPTAIGSDPELKDFDTQPMWHQMISGNGLANATFMVAVNRIGDEDGITFYGSSFISDPYGRTIVQAPRHRDSVLVADLDLDQRRDWLTFGLFDTRRPASYRDLVDESHATTP